METESHHPHQQQQQQQTNQSSKGERYTILVSRREALEARINERNEKLKRLCIAEAELTGVLPPEIPLEPGEAVPTFRRRVGTSFTLPENLINKLKSEEVNEQAVCALELEYEIQSHITAAALQLANDSTAKKGLKKQRRCEYQQNHRRLQDLGARLNQIKITTSAAAAQKHRKKPRPSVDSESGGEPADLESRDVVASPSNKLVVGGAYLDVPYQSNTMSHSYSHTHVLDTKPMKPQERLHATLSAPQYCLSKVRPANSPGAADLRRPQLQRLGSGGFFAYGMYQQAGYATSPHYPSCAHPQLERISRHDTAFIMSPHWSAYPGEVEVKSGHGHPHQYASGWSPGHNIDQVDGATQLPSRHPSLEGRAPRWKTNRFGSLDRKKHLAHSNPCLESRSVEGLDVLLVEEPPASYGGYAVPSSSSSKLTRHHDHLSSHRNNIPAHVQALRDERAWRHSATSHQSVTGETLLPGQTYPEHGLLPGQTYPEHGFGQVAAVPSDRGLTGFGQVVAGPPVRGLTGFGQVVAVPSDRGLTRTQSLGSVETPNTVANVDTRSIKDMYPSTSYTQHNNYDAASLRRQKEKEWYETSLDAAPPSRRPSGHSCYEVDTVEVDQEGSEHSYSRVKPPSRRPSGHSGYEVEVQLELAPHQESLEHVYPRMKPSSRRPSGYDMETLTVQMEPAPHHEPSRRPSGYDVETLAVQNMSQMEHQEQTPTPELLAYPREKPPSRRPSGYDIEPPQVEVENISLSPSDPRAATEIAANEYFDTVVPFESSKNHMVIEAGKWQPYWETTKPFEMSDFYKYSTKFRKKAAPCQSEPTQPLRLDELPAVPSAASPTPSMSPQHKGIYQPLQPMTCQPVDINSSSAALMVAPPDQQSPAPHVREKVLSPNVLSPNASADTSLRLPNGESLADAFSSEMLAWYQDKSSLGRSATLV